MTGACTFEDLEGINWARMGAVLSPQLNAHGCRRIVFDVVQRLKSRRYDTVLNTFTVRASPARTLCVPANTRARCWSDEVQYLYAEGVDSRVVPQCLCAWKRNRPNGTASENMQMMGVNRCLCYAATAYI
jgi:hypothetical protein